MKRIIVTLFLMSAALPALANEEGLKIDVVAGGQAVDTDNKYDSWFQEYAFKSDGAIVPLLRVQRMKPDDPLYFDLKGKWVLRDDQSYKGTLGYSGRGRLKLFYDQTPHWYFRNSTVLWNEHSGLLTLDNGVRSDLETAAFGSAPVTDVPPVMERVLESTGHPSDLAARRDTYGFEGDATLAPGWRISARASHENRLGDKLTSAGTYVRQAPDDSTFDRERFDVRGTNLVETVDYETVQGGVSTDYRGRYGFVQAGVDFSAFRNELDGLRWDNPFEASPGERTIDGGPQGNRGRFARGQMALAPDNDFMRGTLSGLFKISSRARLSVTLARARMSQDQAFLPFTLNDAIYFPGPDGTLGTADDVVGTDLSLLPASSLNGEINTTRFDARLSGRPTGPITLEATGRYYKYDDKTPRLNFPGYAAFGESAFRRGIGQKEGDASVLFNEPSMYDQIRLGVKGGWTIQAPHLVTVGYERVMTDYERRQVDKTNEDIITARLRGGEGVIDWNAFYQIGRRTHDGEYEIGLEKSKLRMFDVWDRDRDRFGAEIDAELSPGFIVGLSGSRLQDKYPGKVEGAAYDYGLQESNLNEVALTGSYQPANDRWTLSGALGMDNSEWKTLAVTKTGWDATTDYDPVNRWSRNQDDRTVWGSADLRAELVPGRWTGQLRYRVNAYTGDVLTANPELTDHITNSAYALEWSELKTTWHEFQLALDHWFMPGFAIGLRYTYSPFRIEDPAWNSLQPYMQGTVEELRSSPDDLRDANASRFLFIDSRYDDTNAHVVGLVITASLM